ncbi:MAG: hypothetical protein ACLT0Y_05565 [Christensenellales bacterium]
MKNQQKSLTKNAAIRQAAVCETEDLCYNKTVQEKGAPGNERKAGREDGTLLPGD